MRRTQRGISLAVVGLVLGTIAPASAQPPADAASCEICPEPQVEVTPNTGIMTVEWDEVPPRDGRVVSNVVFEYGSPPPDPDSVSTVTFQGAYIGECDYRLTISKIPYDPGFDLNVRLVYRIATNTTGTGAPVAQDTLDVFQPDQDYFFNPDIAGNLALRFGSNVSQPADLGSVPVTVSGLYAGRTRRTEYVARALNSVSSLSEGLRVEVRGPINATIVPVDTLLVTVPDSAYAIMDGMELSFGEIPAGGSGAPGDSTTWTAHFLMPATGRIRADLEAFEGYHVWRANAPDLNHFFLLGEIRQCESKEIFVHLDENKIDETDLTLTYDSDNRRFRLTDEDIHDDFPYRYAVSTFDRDFLGNVEDSTVYGGLSKSDVFYPARPARDEDTAVYVVPNPYKRSADWEEGEPKIVFANLPNPSTIRIYTAAADHVITLHHRYPGEPRSTSTTSATWNLKSDRNQDVVPGIYIWYVESASFQQVGKMIVVR